MLCKHNGLILFPTPSSCSSCFFLRGPRGSGGAIEQASRRAGGGGHCWRKHGNYTNSNDRFGFLLFYLVTKEMHLVLGVVHGKDAALITVVFPRIINGIQDTGDREDHLCGKMAGPKRTRTNRCGNNGHRSLLRETLPRPRLSGLLSFVVLHPRGVCTLFLAMVFLLGCTHAQSQGARKTNMCVCVCGTPYTRHWHHVDLIWFHICIASVLHSTQSTA